jgi:hypothetical protein
MAWKDLFTVGIAVMSLIVTVVWNLQNRLHTDRVAKKIRSEGFAFDEWKENRSEILRALRDLEAAAEGISLLARGAHGKDDLLQEVNAEALALTRNQLRLLRELERASPLVDWTPLAYGSVLGGESDWDRLNTIVGDLSDLESADDIRQALLGIVPHVRGIAKLVNEEIRVKNSEHDPEYCS